MKTLNAAKYTTLNASFDDIQYFSERKLTEHTPNKGMISKIEMSLKEKRYETIFVRSMASKRKLIAPERSEQLR